ncbi:MAG TPA: hypothetical protein VM261_08655 [Kofleriaceae bacterium]|nr:hypothetical protein [Kofleriaceae bacterium]
MRAEEEYVPEREEDEEKDAEEVLGELDQDRTEEEDVQEEAEQKPEARTEMMRRAGVVEIVRDMLARRDVDVTRMQLLNDQEREALEFLQAVVEGRTKTGKFIYAERRIEHLNLVLADLQPLLSVGQIEGLDEAMAQVVDGIDTLRHELELLEEAQEEVRHEVVEKKQGDDEDDKDDPDNKPDENAAAAEKAMPGSSLAAESTAAATEQAGQPATGAESADGEKKPGLWGRLWNRGKKDEGGGSGA